MSTKYMDLMPLTRKDEFYHLMAMRRYGRKIPVWENGVTVNYPFTSRGANTDFLSLLSMESVIDSVHRTQGITEPLNELPNDTTCEWNGACEDSTYPELCAPCIESYADGKAQLEEDRYRDQ